MALKNLQIYFVFIYFNFFFDCFLGIISCIFRTFKSWIATFGFLPRLDYSVMGRSLEKMDSGFVAYASFIHLECLHTHPVLVYFCSIVNEKIDKRYQILRTSNRDIHLYTRQQQIRFHWWLAITLSRNRQLIKLRKYQSTHSEVSTIESFHELFENKFLEHFEKIKIINKNQERTDSNTNVQNLTTTCTTLLLDANEHHDRKPSF